MHYRDLGKTGLRVSEIGFGGNRLGETDQPDSHWVDLITRAMDLGVNLFDTAAAYAKGRSEEMLGLALSRRPDVLIATKISWDRQTGKNDFSSQRMLQEAETSLKRLRRDRIDIYQLHSPSREDLDTFDWAEGFRRLKEQGKIHLAAVAIDQEADGVWLIEQGLVEVLQLTYNIFETQAATRLLPLAKEKGIGLLCRMPLARGVLSGKFKAGESVPDGHRAHLEGEMLEQRIRLAEDLRPLGDRYPGGMARLAHHFSLTPEAISAIIPGARSIAQLEENVAASNGKGLPAAVLDEIQRIRAGWHLSY